MMTRQAMNGLALVLFLIPAWAVALRPASIGHGWAGPEHSAAQRGSRMEVELSPDDSTGRGRIPTDSLTIVVTYDNNSLVDGLTPEWGFSCVVRGAEKTILFDTGGDGQILMSNIRKLRIDPADVDIVFLSHAHWDHTGGLEAFLKKNPDVTVYLPRSFERGFKRQVRESGAEVIEVHEPIELCRNVHSTGQLGTGIREQSLILRTDRGLIVITGCAHPGIVHIVRKSRDLLDDKLLLAMGGFHLVRSSAAEIEAVIMGYKEAGVQYAAPCHCSGDTARDRFKQEYGPHYIDLGVGKVLKGTDLE